MPWNDAVALGRPFPGVNKPRSQFWPPVSQPLTALRPNGNRAECAFGEKGKLRRYRPPRGVPGEDVAGESQPMLLQARPHAVDRDQGWGRFYLVVPPTSD